MDVISNLIDILNKPDRVTQIIKDELLEIKEEYGDKRRSEIVENAEDLSIEDLIAPQDMVVTLSHTGYIKAQALDDYRAQKRGVEVSKQRLQEMMILLIRCLWQIS